MATPTSYLQSLAYDEAIAFVTSLQSVKAHLSHELQWMGTQVQQKTMQLQGIETLLSEALTLGLLTADDMHSTADAGSVTTAATAPIATAAIAPERALELPAAADEGTPSIESTDESTDESTEESTEPVAAIASLPAEVTSPSPATKATQRGKASGFQRFLRSPFRHQALTDAVSDILNRAAAPLSTDELMAALYDGLPQADYQRVKHSLANILSVGRSKGAWKSTGRGRYAGNAATTR